MIYGIEGLLEGPEKQLQSQTANVHILKDVVSREKSQGYPRW